jgi:hypothetical protein
MGLVKQWQMEQAEAGRHEEFRDWFKDAHGREPTKQDVAKYWDDFELDEAMEHALNKDD